MTDSTEQQREERNSNRSRTPHSAEFLSYISSGWANRPSLEISAWPVADFAQARRKSVHNAFPDRLIRIDAGETKTRSNDTEYRYRPHSAFSHLTGWGAQTVPGSVLLITPKGESILFFRPTADRSSEEFFANSAIGEFWVGARPNLVAVSKSLALETRDLAELETWPGLDQALDLDDEKLAEFVSELRLIKDEFEIAEMRQAVDKSIIGFERVVSSLPTAVASKRGERVVETAFFSAAREFGHDLGYETIAAAGEHACILHWIINDGETKNGDLILVDAGVELESHYTADITRTLPISGTYSPIQRMIYEAVLEAADAAFAVVRPGIRFREVHAAAMKVIAAKTAEWGLLPVSAEESLKPEKQFHRRWMVHGTSHHLGMDVHDCAQARAEMYLDAELKPGMVFTIEPGLYFQPDDELVPAEFRGIGVRIEDDILVTETGAENLSAALPRAATDIENWMNSLLTK